MSTARQLGVEAWLTALGVQQYLPLFSKFKNIEEVLNLSEGDIRNLGVRNGAHRARVVSSLVLLKEKLGRKSGSRNVTPGISPAHSSGPSPPAFLNHPDYASLGQTPPGGNVTDHVPIQVAYQSMHQHLGYIQIKSSPDGSPGSGQELYKYPWYYGNIPRQVADQLVLEDGDFLVRDSISQPGDYVLTCSWHGAPLHFVINHNVHKDKDGKTKEVYQFEENKFPRVSELIQFYISNKKPISELSGAIISKGVLRTVNPEQTAAERQSRSPSRSASFNTSKSSPLVSPSITPVNSPSTGRRLIIPRRSSTPQPLKKSATGTCLTRQQSASSDTSKQNGRHIAANKSAMHRVGSAPSMAHLSNANMDVQNIKICDEKKTPSCTSVENSAGKISKSIKVESQISNAAPPKPTRNPTIKYISQGRPRVAIRNAELYEDDGKDYSDYDQVKAWPEAVEREKQQRTLNKAQSTDNNLFDYDNPRKQLNQGSYDNCNGGGNEEDPDYDNNFTNAAKMEEGADLDYDIPRTKERTYAAPLKDKRVSINRESNKTVAAPTLKPKPVNHKEESSDKTFAAPGLTKVIFPNLNEPSQFDPYAFNSVVLPAENKPLEGSAMAIIKALLLETSPDVFAQHLTSVDLEVMKVIGMNDLGVGVFSGLEAITLPQGHRLRQDIIERYSCLSNFLSLMVLVCSKFHDRAKMVHTLIQTANYLRSNLGNLFAFSAVMKALKCSHVVRLKNTWISLKHHYAGSAFLYETKLTAALKTLDEGSSSLPLQNVTVPHVMPLIQLLERDHDEHWESWEDSSVDYGLDILLTHLDTARLITEQYGLYRVTAENALRHFKANPDLLEICQTEFHLRLMWGSRGAGVNRDDRNNKLEQLLSVLSLRAEPSSD